MKKIFAIMLVSVFMLAGIAFADILDWIKRSFNQMKADGRLTQGEREKMDRMLDRTDKMIFNKKHNPIARVYQADILDRIAEQQQRINQGVRSGALTRGEADTLQDSLDWIKRNFNQMKADGRLRSGERGE
ncbi:MAG: hypothetical protein WC291_08315, partial [Thermodesulfovibrionales bacterium]